MEKNWPNLIYGLLLKDKSNKSPLDLALDKRFPKNTELMIKKLWLLEGFNLSHLFWDRFSELLSLNITSFHEYLAGCFFQTQQMQNSKYIELKKKSDLWLTHHHSWLIDQIFKKKHWIEESTSKEKKEEDKKIPLSIQENSSSDISQDRHSFNSKLDYLVCSLNNKNHYLNDKSRSFWNSSKEYKLFKIYL